MHMQNVKVTLSKVGVETDRQTDGRTEAIALPPMRSVKMRLKLLE